MICDLNPPPPGQAINSIDSDVANIEFKTRAPFIQIQELGGKFDPAISSILFYLRRGKGHKNGRSKSDYFI